MQDAELILTRDDTRAASVLFIRNKMLRPRNLLLVGVLCLTLPVPILLIGGGVFPGVREWLGMVLMLIVGFTVIYLGNWVYAHWWGARMLKRHPHLRHPFRLSISDAGVSLRGAQGTWTSPWPDFTGLVENEDVMLLLCGPRLFTVLPQRVLTEDDRMLIRRKLQPVS